MIINRSAHYEKKTYKINKYEEVIVVLFIVRWHFFGIPVFTHKRIDKANI